MRHIRRLLFSLFIIVLSFAFGLSVYAAERNPFADVSENAWYYPYVSYALENNFMNGKGTDENGLIIFDPEGEITRAEFVQSLYSKEGKPKTEITTAFSDVHEGDWFAEAVSWAAANGLVAGKGNYFDVDESITRQEVATILYQYASKTLGYSVVGRTELTSFSDANQVSDWAVDKLEWAVHYGVMAGKGNGVVPTASATRAECVTMLKSFVSAYTEEYTSIGMHDFEWIITKEPSEAIAASIEDFGSRTFTCESCGAKKVTESMINIGDRIICGVFDDEDAAIFMDLTNFQRRFCLTVDMDLMEIVCPIRLTELEELNFIAKLRAAEAAIEFNHDKMRTLGENLEWGSSNAQEAHTVWCNSQGHLQAMINPEFWETGGACFWYDEDGSGTNMVPVRVQVFEGTTTGQMFPPIEPDEDSKQIIPNDVTGIPDVAFYQTAVEEYDRNGDGQLSYGEAACPAQLEFSDKGIKDLRGIEFFVGATKLLFAGNEISDLSPMEKLTDVYWYIDLSNNQITDVTALKKVNVSELYLADNQITDIAPLYREYGASTEDYMTIQYYAVLDLSGNGLTKLSDLKGMLVKELYLANNGITDISDLKDMLLQYNYGIDLSYNNISDISVLDEFGTDRNPFEEVDYINLSHNKLTQLNVIMKAVSINLSYNQLTSIASPNATAGTLAAIGRRLDVSHNQISDLSPIAGYYGSKNCVEYLNASYNNITTVEPINNILFGELNLSHNQISDVSPFATMTMQKTNDDYSHRTFDITYNNITDLSAFKDSNLVNSIVNRIEAKPDYFLLGDTEGNVEYKEICIAEGNNITYENAVASLPESLLEAKLYSAGTVNNNFEYRPTVKTWLSTEAFVGTTTDDTKNGLVLEDGVLNYYEDGEIDYVYVGIVGYEGKQYYVERGFVDTSLTGLFYVVEDGRKAFVTGQGQNLYQKTAITELYSIREGAVNTEFTGVVCTEFVTYNSGTEVHYDFYYLTEGVLDEEYTGVGIYWQHWNNGEMYVPRHFIKGRFDDTFDGTVAIGDYCWTLENGVLSSFYTGLAINDAGEHKYYKNSAFDATYSGVAESAEDDLTYYVTDGFADTTKNGLFYINSNLYNFVNGIADFNYTGTWEDPETGKIYYVKDSHIQTNYTGVVVFENEAMYFTYGILDTSKNELIQYYGKYYNFVNGVASISLNGFVASKDDFGSEIWYYYEDGTRMLTDYTGFKEGTINGITGEWFMWMGTCIPSYDGVVIVDDSTAPHYGVYIEGGQRKTVTGIYGQYPNGGDKNWYVVDGVVDFTFTDSVIFDGYIYYFRNGKVSSYQRM